VRFMTLTDGCGDMDFAAFYAAWSRKLRPRLRRRGKLGDYACALEVHPQSVGSTGISFSLTAPKAVASLRKPSSPEWRRLVALDELWIYAR